MKTLLVVSPHPDDLEIGMGGSVARATELGGRVISAVLTDGRRSPRSFECSDEEMAEIRKREAEEAGHVLGIETIFFFGLSDLRSDDNRRQAGERLIELLGRYRPEEFYLPHPELDRHESIPDVRPKLQSSVFLETSPFDFSPPLAAIVGTSSIEAWTCF